MQESRQDFFFFKEFLNWSFSIIAEHLELVNKLMCESYMCLGSQPGSALFFSFFFFLNPFQTKQLTLISFDFRKQTMKNFLNPAHKLVFLSAALLFMQKYIKISRIKRKCNQLSNRKKSKRLNSNNNNKKEREGKKRQKSNSSVKIFAQAVEVKKVKL